MILYDKDTKFIGVSADVLSVLGYEDMGTFTSYNNDVADLFVNRQGYVHKFDNFSWINYVLSGSLPSKNVIMTTRKGGEIEATLSISEIFTSEGGVYYAVGLNDINYLSDEQSDEAAKANKKPIFKIEEDTLEPTLEIPDTESEKGAKISFKFDEADMMTPQSDLKQADKNVNSDKDKKEPAKVAEVKIDIQEISDLLGIEQGKIIAYMQDYAEYLKNSVSKIKVLQGEGNTIQLRKTAIDAIGIGSNLRVKEVVAAMQKLLTAGAGVNTASLLQEIESVTDAFAQSVSKL